MPKAAKGSIFERALCKKLSLWWTEGKRDDVFWRTAGSGARATSRRKQGKTTFGQCGDMQATDPIGQPLLDLVHMEFKRGYGGASPYDLVDALAGIFPPYYKWLEQIAFDREESGAKYFWLITQRDRRQPILHMPAAFCADIAEAVGGYLLPVMITAIQGGSFVSVPLNGFLEWLDPQVIKNMAGVGEEVVSQKKRKKGKA